MQQNLPGGVQRLPCSEYLASSSVSKKIRSQEMVGYPETGEKGTSCPALPKTAGEKLTSYPFAQNLTAKETSYRVQQASPSKERNLYTAQQKSTANKLAAYPLHDGGTSYPVYQRSTEDKQLSSTHRRQPKDIQLAVYPNEQQSAGEQTRPSSWRSSTGETMTALPIQEKVAPADMTLNPVRRQFTEKRPVSYPVQQKAFMEERNSNPGEQKSSRKDLVSYSTQQKTTSKDRATNSTQRSSTLKEELLSYLFEHQPAESTHGNMPGNRSPYTEELASYPEQWWSSESDDEEYMNPYSDRKQNSQQLKEELISFLTQRQPMSDQPDSYKGRHKSTCDNLTPRSGRPKSYDEDASSYHGQESARSTQTQSIPGQQRHGAPVSYPVQQNEYDTQSLVSPRVDQRLAIGGKEPVSYPLQRHSTAQHRESRNDAFKKTPDNSRTVLSASRYSASQSDHSDRSKNCVKSSSHSKDSRSRSPSLSPRDSRMAKCNRKHQGTSDVLPSTSSKRKKPKKHSSSHDGRDSEHSHSSPASKRKRRESGEKSSASSSSSVAHQARQSRHESDGKPSQHAASDHSRHSSAQRSSRESSRASEHDRPTDHIKRTKDKKAKKLKKSSFNYLGESASRHSRRHSLSSCSDMDFSDDDSPRPEKKASSRSRH